MSKEVTSQRLDAAIERLSALEAEHARLLQLVGVRLGTFAKLRQVERQIKRARRALELEQAIVAEGKP
jgi:hypothetical protein